MKVINVEQGLFENRKGEGAREDKGEVNMIKVYYIHV
jgi:hypothetical protein